MLLNKEMNVGISFNTTASSADHKVSTDWQNKTRIVPKATYLQTITSTVLQ